MNTANRYNFLDSIRGIAILLVIMVHVTSGITFPYSDLIDDFLHAGNRGVQLFFMLSGLALFVQYQKELSAQSRINWKSFYIRRAYRIMPLWLLMVPVYVMFNQDSDFFDIIGTALFYNGFIITNDIIIDGGWSIFVEVCFYALFPLLCVISTNFWRTISLTILFMGLSYWMRYGVAGGVSDGTFYDYIYGLPFTHLFCFTMGIALYFVWNKIQKIEMKSSLHLILGIVSLGIIFLSLPYDIIVACIGFCTLFFMCFLQKGFLYNILNSNRLLMTTGVYSYGIYLTHFVVIKICRFLDVRDVPIFSSNDFINGLDFEFYEVGLYFIQVFFMSYIISMALYHLYEIKFINRAKILTKK